MRQKDADLGAWLFKNAGIYGKVIWIPGRKKKKKKVVWSGNELDSASKREGFSAFGCNGYSKSQAFMVK